ncbi:hypothetical protein [Paenibacillus tundrae]|uniref:Uncharacterized protein n=1 Tax=Paenibacillus tundrae TaxID=528187 RepID=A0ABT9WDP4_9BACL|nr:hypothetical protein [Paenibacillus tundrae]MDQ0171154.1 hypothetical protein [Paenibacillus tundrae]
MTVTLTLFLIVPLLMLVGALALFFVIRYFIKYSAQVNKRKSPQQEELDRMKIEDLK